MTPLPPRLPTWRSRLFLWLAEIAPLPLVYGEHDCALFAGGAVRAMHGVDPAERFRGRYRTLTGGLRILRREGFRDHTHVVSTLARPVAPAMAQIGDFAVIDTPDLPALGIVTGGQIHHLSLDGLSVTPLILPGDTRPLAREVWRT